MRGDLENSQRKSLAGPVLLLHPTVPAGVSDTELEIAMPFATTVAAIPVSGGAGGEQMKLKAGKPIPFPLQRRDTGQWLAYGSIAVNNDRELISVDISLYAGEFDTKEEAVRNVCEKADRNFVMRWLKSGGAAQLHRIAA
jgi:hypothetical protein